ncbi:hypothetical protein LINPERHAP1_LOCUS18565 [Linum perenne]
MNQTHTIPLFLNIYFLIVNIHQRRSEYDVHIWRKKSFSR